MDILVRLDGAVAAILNTLVKRGVFKTKSEAIRAGILELGKEYIPTEMEAKLVAAKIKRIEAQIKKGKVKLVPLEKMAKDVGIKL
ncbi:MAG: hypothetical protein KGH49_03145 [Candidatus Micrarchaeota archaeon]|nr:hypothetical protein [Candidatus Micrarchaeota archaeon]